MASKQKKTRKPWIEPFTEEPVALTDGEGQWTGSFKLDLGDDALRQMYRDLLAARLLDERLNILLRTGKVSFVSSANGHEGAQIGIAHAMRRGHDWAFPYYRDAALSLTLTSADAVFSQYQASRDDRNKARQMPCHPGSDEAHVFAVASSIASQVPPAVGTAMAQRLQGTDEVVVTTFGDGATSEGDWHAAVNLAAVQAAPVVFVCENNLYAISVGLAEQTHTRNIADKAHAYAIPGYWVDGMDVLAAHYVMRQTIERARAGDGPALVEMCVYRYSPHSSADDDSVYRPSKEVEQWKKRDPIERFRRFLERRKLWDKRWEESLRSEINEAFAAAVKRAEAAGEAPPEWLFDDVYAALPWHLEEQRQLLADELDGGR